MAALKIKSGPSGLDSLSLPGKIIVGLVFVGMIGAAYFVVFYGEVESGIAGKAQLVDVKKEELKKAQAAKLEYDKDVAEKLRKEQLRDKQKQILPDESESAAFLSSVQTVATISGISLASWKPLDEDVEKFYAKVPMELKLTGHFHQIAKFFHGIGQVDRIINMENIAITAVDRSKKPAAAGLSFEDTVSVEVKCLATAFRALAESDAAKANAKKGKKK